MTQRVTPPGALRICEDRGPVSTSQILTTPRRILANIRVLTLSHAYGAIVNFLIPWFLVRLGIEESGVFFLGQVLFIIFRVFSDFGATTLAIRDVARRPEELARYHRAQLALRAAMAGACAAAMFAIAAVAARAGALGPDARFVVHCFAVAMVFDTLSEGYRYSFRALQLMEREAAFNAIERTSVLVLTVAMVFATGSVRACAAAYAIAQLIALVAAMRLARPLLPPSTFRRDVFLYLARNGPSFFAMQASFALYNRIDMLVLGLLSTKLQVGLYGLAYFPLKGLLMVPEVAMMSLYPAFSELHHSDTARLRETVRGSFRYLAGITFLAAVAVALGHELLVELMLLMHRKAEDTSALGAIITVLILSAPLYTVTSISGHVMAATGRQLRLSKFYVAALTFNIAVNVLYAVPQWGALGAAATTVATEALLSVALVLNLPDGLDRVLRTRAALLATTTCAVAALFAFLPGR